MISHSFIYQNNIFQITISYNNLNSHGQTVNIHKRYEGEINELHRIESFFNTERGMYLLKI